MSFDLGNTRDVCVTRRGDFRNVQQVSDRDQFGRWNMWSWQDTSGTMRQVEQMRQIERADGRVYLGSVPVVHYNELCRLRRLEKMDQDAWDALLRGYLSHRSFSKFRGNGSFHQWTPYDWFFEILDNPKDLTKFYARRRAEQGLLAA